MSKGQAPAGVDNHASWLVGGGAMGAFIRAKDWSQTPLGPLAEWPDSLRTSVSLALASNFPISLAWGPERTRIYNDGYWPICGAKHPDAMGQDFKACWLSAWPVIGEAFESASAGKTAFLENQRMFLDRHGFLEETFFTFSFSPIRDASGEVAGLFHPVTEMTAQLLAERRLEVLRQVAAAAADFQAATDTCAVILRALDERALDLPFVALYLSDAAAGVARLAGTANLPPASKLAPAEIALAPESTGIWPLYQAAQVRDLIELDDLAERCGPIGCGPYEEDPNHAFIVPIVVPGLDAPFGYLVAGASPRVPLNDAYRAFYGMLRDTVTTALLRARAYEEEKARTRALAEMDRAKTAFFSNVSHEFRTPLTLMLGPLERALEASGELPANLRVQLDTAHRNALRLLKLVNSMLDFSRIEAGRVHARYQRADLAEFTAQLASNFHSACESAGLDFHVECSPLSEDVFVDLDMWEKIVLNLISNAFKYTLDGHIGVLLRERDGMVELVVSDSGVGIDDAELPRLFERFYRVEGSEGRTHEGTGIGLALIQELVHLHGGSVRVESKRGKGSRFVVSIPVGWAHLPPEHIVGEPAVASPSRAASSFAREALHWLPESASRPAHGPARPSADHSLEAVKREPLILVADDNRDMRNHLRGLLEGRFQVLSASNGEEALALIRKRRPELVLSDVMMPRMDGFELLRAIRNDPELRTTPIILLSARAGEEARVEGLDRGADDYLVKPFGARELLARVDVHLRMAQIRREADMRFQALANNLPISVWLHDQGGALSFVNQTARAYFGVQRGHLDATRWWRLFAPESVHLFRDTFFATLRERSPFKADIRVQRHDGQWRWIEVTARPWFGESGVFLGQACTGIDVTDRREAQEALEQADRSKDEFLAVLSHELRNPLAPIRSGLRLLQDSDDPQVREISMQVMERQTRQLTRLVDDLLDVARITQGKIHLHRSHFDLREAVNSAVESSRHAIEAFEHRLELSLPDEPIIVDADLERLAQVFANLLVNAARYTPPGGHIKLRLARQNGHAVVSVQDNGIGIEAGSVERVFDKFVQLGLEQREADSGLGLGLSIVKSLVDLHGGEVSASSAGEGKGSLFQVTVPCAAASGLAPRSGRESPAENAGSDLRVLVVDDNRDAAQVLALHIELMGFQVRQAHGGEAAVELAETFRPHVTLMDLGMPRVDGYEAARRIRTQEWGRGITLVALTGWGQDEQKAAAREAGFDQHLVKPAAPEEIESILRAASIKAAG